MSGHSKWSQIKHKKAVTDKKRGATFSKLAMAITIIAREGGGDLSSNFRLRLAIDKAKQANMPNDNIERAIQKGTGESGGKTIEEFIYEGFGPKGIAVICEGATDNKNRTLSEIKLIFSEHNGRLAGSGAVAYQFEPKGIINVDKPKNIDELELELIDIGAEDFEENKSSLTICTSPTGFGKVRKAILEKKLKINSAELVKEAKDIIQINDKEDAEKIIKFIESLEDHQDVFSVFTNFDISENILNQLEG